MCSIAIDLTPKGRVNQKEKHQEDVEDMEIANALYRTQRIIESKFLQRKSSVKSLFYVSAVIEFIIHLKFLLESAEKFGVPVNFSDDIPPFKGRKDSSYVNITGLVRFFRNAVCHQTAYDKRKTNKKGVSRGSIFQIGTTPSIHDPGEHFGKYNDDIAFIMGDHYIYIKRHLIRAANEVLVKFTTHNRLAFYPHVFKLRAKNSR